MEGQIAGVHGAGEESAAPNHDAPASPQTDAGPGESGEAVGSAVEMVGEDAAAEASAAPDVFPEPPGVGGSGAAGAGASAATPTVLPAARVVAGAGAGAGFGLLVSPVSSNEFSSPKRGKKRDAATLEADDAAADAAADDDDDDDDDALCSICFEPWCSSGPHQVSSLKCGHLFGKNCIEKWLKGRGDRCPQCNAKAHKKEIR